MIKGGYVPLFDWDIFIIFSLLDVLLYIIMFPYLLLVFRSDFYRKRFYNIFRLKGMVDSYTNQNIESLNKDKIEDKGVIPEGKDKNK